MEKLKPCPFCGSEETYWSKDKTGYYRFCSMCGARGPVSETREETREKWNRRTDNA